MAKSIAVIACFLAFATIVSCERFDVEGIVYCDPCKFGFKNELSHPLNGATVELRCTDITTGAVTFNQSADTNPEGKYLITVEGDHQNDVCEVKPVFSLVPICNTVIPGSARIELTENSGMHTDLRQANPLGFMSIIPTAGCKKALEDLLLDDDQTNELEFLTATERAELQ